MIRLGIIGVGARGIKSEFWDQVDNAVVTAVADIDDKSLKTAIENIGGDIYATNDYKKLLNRKDVDAVAIYTPDHLHYEQAMAAFEKDKHVYIDKPITITIETADKLINRWEKSGKKLMIGHNMRYISMYETMKRYIDKGYIGDVKSIWVRHFVGRGGRFYYQDWHRNSKYTNSLLIQKGSHDIDIIHMLGGSYTKKVSAFGSLDFYNDEERFKADGLTHQTDAEIDVEDNNIVIMELENGIKASYLQCHFTPDYSRNYVVIGTKGRMENDDVNDTITIKTRNTDSLHDKSDLVIEMKSLDQEHGGADPRIAKAFIDYILYEKTPNSSPKDARMSIAVGVKATESLRSGGGVKSIPPYPEQ